MVLAGEAASEVTRPDKIVIGAGRDGGARGVQQPGREIVSAENIKRCASLLLAAELLCRFDLMPDHHRGGANT